MRDIHMTKVSFIPPPFHQVVRLVGAVVGGVLHPTPALITLTIMLVVMTVVTRTMMAIMVTTTLMMAHLLQGAVVGAQEWHCVNSVLIS